MTNCDSILNLLLIFETIHPFSINFASDRKELIEEECIVILVEINVKKTAYSFLSVSSQVCIHISS